jgi:uncharacterized protein
MADWREAVVEYIRREAKPVEKFGHQPRLYALTQEIGRGLSYDDDVVFAACWLHDLGVFVGHRPENPEALAVWDNTAYAVERAPGILMELGFPEGKISAVVDAIVTHQPGGDPGALEGTILRDADILEQLGAIGILRTVCKVGKDTRFHTFSDAAASLRKAVDGLPGQVRLDSTRVLMEEKIQVMGKFLGAVEVEGGETLF